MKKNYLSIVFTLLSFAMFSQTTVVLDTLRAGAAPVFYVDYNAVPSTSGVTFTLNLNPAPGFTLGSIQEVEIYRSYDDNRVSGRVRIQRYLDGSSGTVTFVDDSQVWTADSNSSVGYTGDGAFEVGRPTAYSVKVILTDNSSVNSQRTAPVVYYTGAPAVVVNDVINADMTLQTRVYENFPAEESALLVVGLVPSTNYPSNPYKLFQDASLARQNPGYVNWQSYPAFISEVLFNEVSDLAGRQKSLDPIYNRAFWSYEGALFLLVESQDINAEDIAADGTTNVSFKIGRPNSTQPANGFTYNSLVSVPITIRAALSIENTSKVSTVIKAIGSRIDISNVRLQTEVNIYNLTGALVKSIKTNEDTSFEFTSGLYIATIATTEGQKSVKLLLQ